MIADPRDRLADQLLLRGYATMRELLTASFGEWPPKGLDIDPAVLHEQKIALEPLTGAAENEYAEASPIGAARRFIRVAREKSLAQGRLAATLGHEVTHILQGDHAGRKKASFFKRKVAAPAEAACIMTDFISDPDNLSFRFQRVVARKEPDKDRLGYFSQGIEIQARLHEILTEGYAKAWHRLPATRDELWQALRAAGLKMPPEVRGALDGEWSSGFQVPVAVGKINSLLDSLSDKGKAAFWTDALPALYADLIEMYGDKPGRSRFGLGENKISQNHGLRR